MGSIGSAIADPELEKIGSGPRKDTETKLESQIVSQSGDTPHILLIKDCDPWDVAANEIALDELEYTYDRLTAADAVSRHDDEILEINTYDVVLIPSTQSREYYETLQPLWSNIDTFVDNGGTLVVHAGERGWPCGIDDSLLEFPGSVYNEYTFEVSGGGVEVPELQEMSVIQSDHPIVEGLDGEDLSYWASDISSFGHFEGLPDNAVRVAGLSIDPVRHPSYVEYPFGDGRVLATMQPPEWPFGDSTVRDGTEQLLYQELEYAIETDPEPEPEPEPSKGRIAGTVQTNTGESTGITVSLIDPRAEYKASEYATGNRETPPEPILQTTTDENGEFSFEDIEPARRVVLVDIDDPYDPEYKRVAVTADETTRVSFEAEAERYLSALDDEVEQIRDAALANVRDSTEDAANVYVDGAQLFNNELDLEADDYLVAALEMTNFALGLADPNNALDAATQIKAFVAEQTAIPTAEYGYHRFMAGKWDDLTPKYREELEGYSEVCLSADWLTNLSGSDTVPNALTLFNSTNAYQDAQQQINTAYDTYDTEIVYTEPNDNFSISETKRVLQSQIRWLEGSGLAPGIIFTPPTEANPSGLSSVTRESKYHRDTFDDLHANFETTEALDAFATGTAATGKSVILVTGATGAGAAAGSVAKVAGTVGSLAISMYQLQLQNQLANAWVDSLQYWVSDLRDNPNVATYLLGWIEQEATNPDLRNIDGEINEIDLGGITVSGTTYALANEPEYPSWWWRPTPLWKRRATNTVSIENTGSTPANIRVISVDTYGDGRSAGVSDAVSCVPADDDDTVQLQPGDTKTVEHEYAADFHPFSPLNWHYMSTTLWMDGKYVDEVEQPYYIVPSLDVIPFSSSELENDPKKVVTAEAELSSEELLNQSLQTDSYVITDGSEPAADPMTVEDWTEYVGDIEPLIEGEVSSEKPSVSVEQTVEPDTAGVIFLLGTTPDTELNLHVRDENENHVGYDPSTDDSVVEIPNTEYNGHESAVEVVSIDQASGTYEVEASAVSFRTDSPVPVSLYMIQIPERESIFTVLSESVNEIIKPGTTTTGTIRVGEVGGQAGITVEDIQIEPFKTVNEDILENVVPQVNPKEFELEPNEESSVSIKFDAASSVPLPEAPETRFSAPVEIETADSGTAEVTVSLLLLRTDIPDAKLTSGAKTIEGVSFSSTDHSELPHEPPSTEELASVYTVNAVGEGEGTVRVPTSIDEPHVYVLDGNDWNSVETSDSVETSNDDGDVAITFTASATELTVAVTDTEPDEDPAEGPPDVGDYAVDGEYPRQSVFDAIADWSDDTVDRDIVFDVIEQWGK